MIEKLNNIVYDTNYTNLLPQGGFVVFQKIDDTQVSVISEDGDSTTGTPSQVSPTQNSATTTAHDHPRDTSSAPSQLNTASPVTISEPNPNPDTNAVPASESTTSVPTASVNPEATAPSIIQPPVTPNTLEITTNTTSADANSTSVASAPSVSQTPITEPVTNTVSGSDLLGAATNIEATTTPATQGDTTTTPTTPDKKAGFFDNLFGGLFGGTKKPTETAKSTPDNPIIANKSLKEQVKYILELPDEEYSDKKITQELRKYIMETEKQYNTVLADYKSHIAPSFWKVEGPQFQLSGLYGKAYYMQTYPSYLDALWTRDILSFHGKWDMSFYIYPEDDSAMQAMLKHKATQLKSEMNEAYGKGITLDTEIEIQYRDVDEMRQKLATREERYYETGYYTVIYDEEKEKLNENSKKFEQKIAGLGMKIKPAIQRMDEGFMSSLPLCIDQLGITRSTITSSLGGSFPFVSQDMLSTTGILYGVNQHTGGLVIFDRFNSNLPNMNSVVLATSGAGKSFTVKLEILRYLLNNIDIIVIDPENEYQSLVNKVGGTYINISTGSSQFINPFDIPPKIEDRDYGKGDLLRGQIMGLIGLINILIGGLTPEQEALLDTALQTTYQLKGITLDQDDYTDKQPPLMSDLYNVLQATTGAENIAVRLSKYVNGSFAKIFNNYTNVDINSNFTVFSIRDLEDALKTPAMYSVLNFIWTKVRSQKKKRLLICDEAWIMLQNDTSAEFLFGLIKRARKYGLGITTISQDIEDFMRSKYGKPIVSNSSLQVLLKQSTSSVKTLEQIIGLSEAEKQRLVAAGVGEGLLFAGNQHIALKILASPQEKEFITTNIT